MKWNDVKERVGHIVHMFLGMLMLKCEYLREKKQQQQKQCYFLFQKFTLTHIVRVRVLRKIEFTSSDVLNIPKNSCLINIPRIERGI